MKTRILILILIIGLGALTSCDKNEDNPTQDQIVNGTWNLKNVSGGLQGINIDYSLGEVKWTFNPSNSTLIVENIIDSTGPKDIYAGHNSGTYNYEIRQDGEINTLFIDDVKRGVIILIDSELKIDDGLAADGFITEFER